MNALGLSVSVAVLVILGGVASAQGLEGARAGAQYFGSSNTGFGDFSASTDMVFTFGSGFGVQVGARGDTFTGGGGGQWYAVDAHAFYQIAPQTRAGLFAIYEGRSGFTYTSLGGEIEYDGPMVEVEARVMNTMRNVGPAFNETTASLDVWYDLNDRFRLHGGAWGLFNGPIPPTDGAIVELGGEYQVSDRVSLYGDVGFFSSATSPSDTVYQFGLRVELGDNPSPRYFESGQFIPNLIAMGF